MTTETIAAATVCPCCTYPPPKGTDRGWHVKKGPLPFLLTRHGIKRYTGERIGHWFDHVYRYLQTDGRWAYVAEPYEVWDDDFADLAFLDANGFDVLVTARDARHYPGHSVCITITETRNP